MRKGLKFPASKPRPQLSTVNCQLSTVNYLPSVKSASITSSSPPVGPAPGPPV
ncbi:MAG: hypothetical protein HC894_15870, partial [Microcoleus sp. SM1_3_4]|nr:hypothetical protein [Microcoleus sp. SM1_3_4]